MTNTLQCNIAENEDDRQRVFRLRYQCYRRDQSIEADASELFRDPVDSDPNHFSFLVRDPCQSDPVATVRMSVVRPDLGWHHAPSMHVFGDHPALQKMGRESLVEASRLCFARQARRDTLFALLAHMPAIADFYQVEWLVACPRVEHAHTYRRLFGFQTLAAPRRYYGVKFKTELLAVRRSDLHSYVSGRHGLAATCQQVLADLERCETRFSELRMTSTQ